MAAENYVLGLISLWKAIFTNTDGAVHVASDFTITLQKAAESFRSLDETEVEDLADLKKLRAELSIARKQWALVLRQTKQKQKEARRVHVSTIAQSGSAIRGRGGVASLLRTVELFNRHNGQVQLLAALRPLEQSESNLEELLYQADAALLRLDAREIEIKNRRF